MRAYTRYGRVEKPNGEELAPDEYLEEVEREVAEAILERIFGTDRQVSAASIKRRSSM